MDLKLKQSTIDFIFRLFPNYKPSQKISEMFKSDTGGFKNKKYKVEEDNENSKTT